MKKILVLLSILSFIQLYSKEVLVNPEMTSVKVYLAGAELTSKAKVDLTKGFNTVIFDNLPKYITENTIRANATEGVYIVSLTDKIEEITNDKNSPELKILYDSLKIYQNIIDDLKNNINTNKEEIEILQKLDFSKSTTEKYTIEEIIQFTNYYQKKVSEIRHKNIIINNDYQTNLNKLQLISKKIKAIEQSQRPTAIKRIAVTLNAEKSGPAEVYLTYFSQNAGWEILYDLKAKDIKSDIELISKANVWQNTGVDWVDIPLILSTGNPNRKNDIPQLTPQYLNIKESQYHRSKSYSGSTDNPLMPITTDSRDKLEVDFSSLYTVNVNSMFTEYHPKINYTILTDNQKHTVNINSQNIPAKYMHYTVPKLDVAAYLIAKIGDWGSYNLLSGKASIFLENSYISETYIDVNSANDTLMISFGVDNKVQIDRVQIKDFTEDKFFSSKKIRTYGYQIKVKNNRQEPIDIVIQDQIPVSKHSKIQVELLENGGGVLNDEFGYLNWKTKIDANDKFETRFIYQIDAP